MWLIYYIYCMFAFTNEISTFIIFIFLVAVFSTSLREIPLTLLVELV